MVALTPDKRIRRVLFYSKVQCDHLSYVEYGEMLYLPSRDVVSLQFGG